MYQAFSLLVVLIACASIVVGNGTQIIDWHALNDAEPNQDDSHIQFILYNRKLTEGTTDMSHLKKKLHTFVLIHGFNDNLKDSIMLPLLTKNYLNRERCNVVVVDWAEFAKGPWFINAAKNTLFVGKELAAWLDTSGLDMRRVTLVGFSMGAHVAGDAGHFARKRISRIVALDPAHFLFQNSPPEFRLDSTDAEIVEVVHTSGGYVGEKEALGTRDFFPNGGTYPQPGCSPDPTGTCSHRRAYYYYSEAILKPDDNFKGRRCNSYDHFVKHKCREKGIPIILHLVNTNVDKQLTGNFYFMTNSKEPFIRRNVSRNGTSTTERQPLTTDKHRTMVTTASSRSSFKEHLTTTDKHRLEKEKLVATTESRHSTAKERSTTDKHRPEKHRQLDYEENHQTTEKYRPAKDHRQLTSTDRRSIVKEHLTTEKYRPGIDRHRLTTTDLRSTKEHWTTKKYRTTKEKQLDLKENHQLTAGEHLTTDKYRPGKDHHESTTTDRRSTKEHWRTNKYRTTEEKHVDTEENHHPTAKESRTDKHRPGEDHRQPATTDRRSITKEHWATKKYRTTEENQMDFEDNSHSKAKEPLTTGKYRPRNDHHQPTTTDRRSAVKEHSTTDKYRPPKDRHQMTTTNRPSTIRERLTTDKYGTTKGNKENRRLSDEEEMTTLKRRTTWSTPTSSVERLMTERHRYFLFDDKPSSKRKSTASKRHWTTSTKRSAVTNKRRAKIGKGWTATTAKSRLKANLLLADGYP